MTTNSTSTSGWEYDLGQLIAGTLIGCLLAVLIPPAYVIRVLIRTKSPFLLTASLTFTVLSGLAILASTGWLIILAVIAAAATLITAWIEQQRLASV